MLYVFFCCMVLTKALVYNEGKIKGLSVQLKGFLNQYFYLKYILCCKGYGYDIDLQ